MTTLMLVGLGLLAFLAAAALTALVRQYALRSDLLDQPNARSSHTVPTPRGGGVAIVVTFLLLLVALRGWGWTPLDLALGLGVAGALVAVIGFIDDRAGLSARLRFAGHTLAALWLLWQFGPLPKVPVFGVDLALGLPGEALALVYVVWSTNLYNFMDGIDGIASLQVITVVLAGSALSLLAGQPDAVALGLALAGSVLGFLVWNFPKARIFMGDAGSGFLGLAMAALALWHGHRQAPLFWCWFILNGCFMVDATTTLIRRVRRGERFHEAHRSHAYQHASRLLGSHVKVSWAVAAINLAWLLPLAALVANGRLDGTLGVLIAYGPLVLLAFRLHAGNRAAQKG